VRASKALAVLAGTAVLALCGCASGPDAAAPSAPGPGPGGVSSSVSGTVAVFAAASLGDVFAAIEEEFTAANPDVTVVVNYGGSSGLAEQIVQGAPADVFAAASPATMSTVTDAGLASEPAVFASNTLELVVPAGNPGGVDGLADLERPELAVALCAVEVPCGAASAKALVAAGLAASVDTYEQDVKAVLTKVELGEVDAGLVYRTDVLAAGDAVEGIRFAESDSAVTDYPIAAITDSPNPRAATAFVAFVLSARGQALLAEAGFGAP
jgi:molybdate transport system substrate-binding protein